MSHRKSCIAALSLFALAGVASAGVVVVDFTTEDDGVTPLLNGQHIETDGANTEFGTIFDLYVPSASDHLGGVIFDTSSAGPNNGGQDPDLLVDLGNALTFQSTSAPNQTIPGFFDPANDAVGMGVFEFTMLQSGLGLTEITLIDADSGYGLVVTMTDTNGLTRTITVGSNFSYDIDSTNVPGALGYSVLDLTTLAVQVGEGGGTASGVEDMGFNPNDLASFTLMHTGSGAFDNFTFVPTPGAAGLLGVAGLVAVRRRRA